MPLEHRSDVNKPNGYWRFLCLHRAALQDRLLSSSPGCFRPPSSHHLYYWTTLKQCVNFRVYIMAKIAVFQNRNLNSVRAGWLASSLLPAWLRHCARPALGLQSRLRTAHWLIPPGLTGATTTWLRPHLTRPYKTPDTRDHGLFATLNFLRDPDGKDPFPRRPPGRYLPQFLLVSMDSAFQSTWTS